ncbi:MAG: hypothetical protein KKD64_15155 [Alphaproteobacteria bacterium]|nr:hypothetical protein [Alphaproteobacteria bacterium]MBU0876504.1 hypothetical protein [Alphaproteobacteria bacterium]MBU1770975.1 hypothetical protein [Alphaproteobacteria bacterium]
MINKAILLTTASLLSFAQPAEAARYMFGAAGAVPENSWQTRETGVTQLRLEDGSVVSLVGKSRFRITGGEVTISEGAVTVRSSGNAPVTLRFEGNGAATIRGAASLTVQGSAVRGHVLQGAMTVAGNGSEQSFTRGSAWRMAANNAPARVFANPAQQAPGAVVASLRQEGVRGAAANGLPVTLGFALNAIGAAGDIQQAARAIDARAVQTGFGSLPSGDVELLLTYSDRLAAALATARAGDTAALAPSLINAYLRFLAEGGAAAEFQASYNAVLTQYLQLLAAGGSPVTFEGADLGAVNAYLAYLQSSGLIEQLAGVQQGLVTAYLDYLANGGIPANFQYGEGIDPALLAQYGQAISAYLAYLAQGGDVAGYDGATTAQIQVYLAALETSGLLDSLFEAQASVLRAYLAFLREGGAPEAFSGFEGLQPGLSEALAQQYAAALSAFVAYLQDGGLPSEYGELSQQLVLSYLQALSDAGLLAQLAGDQADFLSDYLAYLATGGDIDAFPGLPTGLSGAEKLAIVDGFLDHIKANGLPSGYTAADFETLLAYFNDSVSLALQQAGRTEDNALLNTYFNYVRYGNSDGGADAFPGLPALGGTIARYATAQSLNRPFAASTGSVSTGGYNDTIVLDANGAPVYISGDVLVGNPTVAQREEGAQTVSTRIYGDRFTQSGQNFALGADQGLHFTTAAPLTNVPTDATINYVLDSATSPTFNDGSSAPGTFTADLTVKFTGTRAQLAAEGSIVMPGDATYSFATPGGIAGVDSLAGSYAISSDWYPIQQSAALTGTGKACVSGASACELYLGATPGGNGASALVLAYGSRNGGEGSIGFTGSAGFVSDPGDSGSESELYGSNVVAYQSAIYSLAGNRFIDATSYTGAAALADDGAIGSITRNGNAVFDRGSLALVQRSGDEGILLSRYEAGTYSSYSSPTVVDGGYLDLVAVADTASLLPVSGTATYTLKDSFSPQTTTGLTDTSFDMSLAVSFGYTPRVAVEGTLGLDTNYTFTTPGGLAAVETDGAALSGTSYVVFAPITSGTGDFCASGASCNVRLIGVFSDGFTESGGYFRTLGSSNVATGVYRVGTENLTNLSFAGGAGVASGTLTAPFEHSEFLPMLVDGGGNNVTRSAISANPLFDGVFDNRGIVSLTYNESNPANDGTPYVVRGSLLTADLAGDADWQVGRFTGGELQPRNAIYGTDNGFSYAVIAPLSNLPENGTISYSLKGATSPVYSNEATAPGVFSGALGLRLGSFASLGLEATVTMPDATYSFQTSGGASNPASGFVLNNSTVGQAMLVFNGNLTPTVDANGAACNLTGSCSVIVSGMVGGDGAGWATLGYSIYQTPSVAPTLTGTAVFEGGPFVPAAPPLQGTAVANQITTYASSVIGIDQRQPTTVTYESISGAPIGYSFSPPNEEPTIGSASLNEEGSVAGIIGWARWASGTTGGTYYALGGVDLPANGGWHIVSGEPATNLPASGTATYALVGSTNPTIRDGSLAPGSVTGSAAVAFGATPRVGVDLNVSIGGSTYGISTAGGAASPATGMEVGTSGNDNMVFRDYNLTASGGGSVCAGSGACTAVFTGFLAGDGASHIGLSYTFGNTGFDGQVDGGVVFGKN